MTDIIERLGQQWAALDPVDEYRADARDAITEIARLRAELDALKESSKRLAFSANLLGKELYAFQEATGCDIADALKAQEPVVRYVPIADETDRYGNHLNDNEPRDDALRSQFREMGDDVGQGLSSYWKWGFAAGWNAYKRSALRPAIPEGFVPVGWLHTMDNTEGIPTNEPRTVMTDSEDNPFGMPGEDYSESFPWTCEQLYVKRRAP